VKENKNGQQPTAECPSVQDCFKESSVMNLSCSLSFFHFDNSTLYKNVRAKMQYLVLHGGQSLTFGAKSENINIKTEMNHSTSECRGKLLH